MLRLRSLATLAILGVLVSGCGGGESSPAERPPGESSRPASVPAGLIEWADAYCSGIGTAADEAVSRLTSPQARIDAAAQKEALLGYLDAAAPAYQGSIERLERLGAPAVTEGQRRQRAALDFYRGSLEAVQRQRERLAALDPAAPDFAQQLSEIERAGFDLASLQPELDALRTDPELARALQQAPACQEIGPDTAG
jgi:hypothetical protein